MMNVFMNTVFVILVAIMNLIIKICFNKKGKLINNVFNDFQLTIISRN